MTPQIDDAALEPFFRPPPPAWARRLLGAWTAVGLFGLTALAIAEPLSARFLPAWARPLVMAARGVLLVEAFGYFYHRFFQHVGRLTRQAGFIRRNQMFHWTHHMILYPIGRFYKRSVPYVSSEKGIAWSWVAPGLIFAAALIAAEGVNLGTGVLIASVALYAKLVVDLAHDRFHLAKHPWAARPYFQWLEKIHVLHHWDQRMNFTIVHPLMDMLFGTYLDPKTHEREARIALDDESLNLSDLLNWSYLLREATPAERAAFISQSRRHPRSLRKLDRLAGFLHRRALERPEETASRDLYLKALDLLSIIRPAPRPSTPTASS